MSEAEAYDGPANGYRASKTFAVSPNKRPLKRLEIMRMSQERAAWDFVEREKPNFTLAVVSLFLQSH